VREYEEGQTTVAQICRCYQVSNAAVYKWIRKYSAHYQQEIVKVVEPKSETNKRLALEERVAELERLLGQKEAQVAYLKKLQQIAEEHYGIDFKKNSASQPSSGSSNTPPNAQ
jgi:transposase-like protein